MLKKKTAWDCGPAHLWLEEHARQGRLGLGRTSRRNTESGREGAGSRGVLGEDGTRPPRDGRDFCDTNHSDNALSNRAVTRHNSYILCMGVLSETEKFNLEDYLMYGCEWSQEVVNQEAYQLYGKDSAELPMACKSREK